MMDLNVTKLQELFYNYNLSFALSILTCPTTREDDVGRRHEGDITTDGDFKHHNGNGIVSDVLSVVGDLFPSIFNGNSSLDDKDTAGKEASTNTAECFQLLDVNVNQKCSTCCIVFISFLFLCLLTYNILCLFRYFCERVISTKETEQEEVDDDGEDDNDIVDDDDDDDDERDFEHSKKPFDDSNESVLNASNNNRIIIIPSIECKSLRGNDKGHIMPGTFHGMDNIFNSTFSLFLKQLESYLGREIPQFVYCESSTNPKSQSPLHGMTHNGMSPQSPRVRRKWKQPQDINPSILLHAQTSEANLRSWMKFEMLCKRMNWSCPKGLAERSVSERNMKEDEPLNVLLKFLDENAVTNLFQWNASVFIVNYSLFLLDEMLKMINVSDKLGQAFEYSRFESAGSASNGTMVGKANHFDVMFMIDSRAADLVMLQNNYYEEIPPGHAIIGMKEMDGKILSKANDLFHKCQIKDTFAHFLGCNQIENAIDKVMREAVSRINTCHKYKMEKLPLKFKMSGTRSLELTIDTSFLNGLGLGLQAVSVRFIPSISIKCSEFSLLPKLYAVPSWRMDHRKSCEAKEKRVGALAKLFRQGSNRRIPPNLFWNLSVSKLENKVLENYEDRFFDLGTHTCHKECLMILKALFSSRNKHILLNKGEINSYILSTVVSFLYMESSYSAWKMSQLPDRVSDAIHFLRSSYNNVWLPNFVINNPHLIKKIPVLNKMSLLLVGRQQNLLADVDTDCAVKTLSFMDTRLNETGLSKIVKPDYSEEMWEYEFFLFG